MTREIRDTGVAVLRLESFRRYGSGVAAQGGIGNWLTALGDRVPRLVAVLPVATDLGDGTRSTADGVWTPRPQDALLALPDVRGYARVLRGAPTILAQLREARRSAVVLICRVPEHGSWLTLPVATALGFRLVLWLVADRPAGRMADRARRPGIVPGVGRLLNRLVGIVEERYLLRHPVVANGSELARRVATLRGGELGVTTVVSSTMRRVGVGDPPGAPAPSGIPAALYVGRIAPDKGIQDLLHAWRSVRADPAGAQAVLHLVGPSSFGEEGRLLREARAIGLDAGSVRWHGPVPYGPRLFDHFRKATLFVSPSRMEGTPRAVGEALAHGLPVVATRAGSTAQVLEDGALGILVPVGDSRAIAEGILSLLRDPDLRLALAARARIAAASRTVEEVADRFADVLQRLGVPRPGGDSTASEAMAS